MPAIQAEMVLIQAIAGDEWWSDVTLGMLENSRKRLRLLVKLIEKSKKKIVYTDFIDELGTETTFDLPEVANGLDMARFKDKAGVVIVDLEDAVAPANKSAARDALAAWLDSSESMPVMLRINAASTAAFTDDLRLSTHPGICGVMVPKAENAQVLAHVAACLPGKP